MVLRWCSRRVFAAFKCFERCAEQVTGAVGPVFIGLALVLITGGIFVYLEVVLPTRFESLLNGVLSSIWSLYIITCTAFYYYMSCCVSPGNPFESNYYKKLLKNQKNNSSSDSDSNLTSLTRHGYNPVENTSLVDAAYQDYLQSLPPFASYLETSIVPLFYSNSNYLQNGHSQNLGHLKLGECKKCALNYPDTPVPKPERCHHCRICKSCALKYDHHCPWINQCVGYYNERYFVLFMTYLCFACGFVVVWAWTSLKNALKFNKRTQLWPYYSPRWALLLLWILCIAIGFALFIMAVWQLYLVAKGETTVESSDNEYYRKLARSKDRYFINVYNLGFKRNLAIFFSMDILPWWNIFIPLPVMPQGDGWRWYKKDGWEEFRIEDEDELTDDDS